jgi:exopolysaccharide production protein ExoQ
MNPRAVIRAPGAPERLFTVFVLLLATGAFLNLLGGEESAAGKGALGIILQTVWSLIYGTTLVLFLRNCKGLFKIIRRDLFLFALVGLAMISVFWSEDPSLTFRRSIALIGTTLFGIYFGRRFSLKDQIRLLSHVFLIGAMLSPIVVAILPRYGLADPEFGYAWQGIYGHKNNLGSAMALGIVVFIFRFILDRPASLRWLAAVTLAIGLLYLSHSSTGLVVCVVALSVFAVAPALRWPPKKMTLFFLAIGAALVGAAFWALNNLTYVLSWVSRDQSFTGRTTIWMVSIVMITRHPWFGYGYSEFWPAYGSDMVARLTGLSEMSHAHNAILNLWLDVGLVGVLIFAVQYCKSLWRSLLAVRYTKAVEWMWPLVFLVFLAAYGLVESVILQKNGLSWILFTAAAVQVSAFKAYRQSVAPITVAKRAAA